jgi:hypothetical protein
MVALVARILELAITDADLPQFADALAPPDRAIVCPAILGDPRPPPYQDPVLRPPPQPPGNQEPVPPPPAPDPEPEPLLAPAPPPVRKKSVWDNIDFSKKRKGPT